MNGTLALFLASDAFGAVFALTVVGVVVALIAWGAIHQKKVRQNWQMFAQKNRLQLQGSTYRPTIQGWLGQVYITLNTVVRGSGKNRTTYTQYHVTVNAPMPSGLVLYKEGFFSKVGKMFGGQDVQVGDAAIDQAFIIKANDLLGTHDLLSLSPVKKALLYTVTRHPGLRVQERQLLVEHTGMTGDLAKIEGVFADLTYLAQTFDVGYQELASRHQPRPKGTVVEREPGLGPAPTQAEVLQGRLAEMEQRSAESRWSDAPARVRAAGPQEDPALRRFALSEMASVLHQYEEKLERGEVVPETPDPFARFRTPAQQPLEDAFAEPHVGDAFDNPHLNDEVEPGSAGVFGRHEPRHVLETRQSDDAFEKQRTAETAQAQPVAGMADSFEGLMGMLGAGSLMSREREEIIRHHTGKAWQVELVVERVDNTWGFDVPEALRDGKTVEAHLKGSQTKVAVRFPKPRNEEIGKLRSGAELAVNGNLAAWDDLFKKATLDAS